MAIKVLIVDDSTFFRKRLAEIIKADPALEVCGEAKDGKEGVQLAQSLRPDVITMDVEMPVMDGISAVKEIMDKCPTPILMFSSLTVEGSNSTFKALEAGAVDFMAKNFDDIAHRREDALREFRETLKAVSRSSVFHHSAKPGSTSSSFKSTSSTSSSISTTPRTSSSITSTHTSIGGATTATASRTSTLGSSTQETTRTGMFTSSKMAYDKILSTQLHNVDQGKPASAMSFTFGNHKGETTKFRRSGKAHEIIAIGSSTGGPIALQSIIQNLPRLSVPIVIVQHMPASFTTTFAQRLNNISANKVVEAKDNDILEPGTIYIAPGGMQMLFEKGIGKTKIKIFKGDNRVAYHPCVDVAFASLAQIYTGRVLALILTGMGSDGCQGCRLLKKAGSIIWAQNEETCVVYGMPQAVVNAKIADQVLPLDKIAPSIVEEMRLF